MMTTYFTLNNTFTKIEGNVVTRVTMNDKDSLLSIYCYNDRDGCDSEYIAEKSHMSSKEEFDHHAALALAEANRRLASQNEPIDVFKTLGDMFQPTANIK